VRGLTVATRVARSARIEDMPPPLQTGVMVRTRGGRLAFAP
jgi:hypothetical protein